MPLPLALASNLVNMEAISSMTVPVDDVDLRTLLKNQKAIFSTDLGEFAPRTANLPSTPIILRSDPTEDKDAMVSSLLRKFPKQCKEISAPISNVYDYFDHYDVQLHGASMIQSVLLEIAVQNTRRGKQMQDFTERWENTNSDRFNSIVANTQEIFTSEEMAEHDTDFRQEALEDLKPLKLSVPSESSPYVIDPGTESSHASAQPFQVPSEIEALRIVGSRPSDYGTIVSMQRHPSLPLIAHDLSSIAMSRPLLQRNNTAIFASPTDFQPSSPQVYDSGPELGPTSKAKYRSEPGRYEGAERSLSLPAMLVSAHDPAGRPNPEHPLSLRAIPILRQDELTRGPNLDHELAYDNSNFDRLEYRRPRGSSLAHGHHRSKPATSSLKGNAGQYVPAVHKQAPLVADNYLPTLPTTMHDINPYVNRQVLDTIGLLSHRPIEPLGPMPRGGFSHPPALLHDYEAFPLSHNDTFRDLQQSKYWQSTFQGHQSPSFQAAKSRGARSTWPVYNYNHRGFANPHVQGAQNQLPRRDWPVYYQRQEEVLSSHDRGNHRRGGQRRDSNIGNRPRMSFSNDARVSAGQETADRRQSSDESWFSAYENQNSSRSPHRGSRWLSGGPRSRRPGSSQTPTAHWEYNPQARGGYSAAGFFGGGSGSGDYSQYNFPNFDGNISRFDGNKPFDKANSNSGSRTLSKYVSPDSSLKQSVIHHVLGERQRTKPHDSSVFVPQGVDLNSVKEERSLEETHLSDPTDNRLSIHGGMPSRNFDNQALEQRDATLHRLMISNSMKNESPGKPGEGSVDGEPSPKLYVTAPCITTDSLLKWFAPFGPVLEISGPLRVLTERRSRRYFAAWLTLSKASGALAAVQRLDGIKINDGNAVLRVKFAHNKSRGRAPNSDLQLRDRLQSSFDETKRPEATSDGVIATVADVVGLNETQHSRVPNEQPPSLNESQSTERASSTDTRTVGQEGKNTREYESSNKIYSSPKSAKGIKGKSPANRSKNRESPEPPLQRRGGRPASSTPQIEQRTPTRQVHQRQSSVGRGTTKSASGRHDLSQPRKTSLGDYLGSPKSKKPKKGKSRVDNDRKQTKADGPLSENLDDQGAQADPSRHCSPTSVPEIEDHNDLWQKIPIAQDQPKQLSEDISSGYPNSHDTSTDPDAGALDVRVAAKKKQVKELNFPMKSTHKDGSLSQANMDLLAGVPKESQGQPETRGIMVLETKDTTFSSPDRLVTDNSSQTNEDRTSCSEQIAAYSQTDKSDIGTEDIKFRDLAENDRTVRYLNQAVQEKATSGAIAPMVWNHEAPSPTMPVIDDSTPDVPIMEGPATKAATTDPAPSRILRCTQTSPGDEIQASPAAEVKHDYNPLAAADTEESFIDLGVKAEGNTSQYAPVSENEMPSRHYSPPNAPVGQCPYEPSNIKSELSRTDLIEPEMSPVEIQRQPPLSGAMAQTLSPVADHKDPLTSPISSAKHKDWSEISPRTSSLPVPCTPISTHRKKKKSFTLTRDEFAPEQTGENPGFESRDASGAEIPYTTVSPQKTMQKPSTPTNAGSADEKIAGIAPLTQQIRVADQVVSTEKSMHEEQEALKVTNEESLVENPNGAKTSQEHGNATAQERVRSLSPSAKRGGAVEAFNGAPSESCQDRKFSEVKAAKPDPDIYTGPPRAITAKVQQGPVKAEKGETHSAPSTPITVDKNLNNQPENNTNNEAGSRNTISTDATMAPPQIAKKDPFGGLLHPQARVFMKTDDYELFPPLGSPEKNKRKRESPTLAVHGKKGKSEAVASKNVSDSLNDYYQNKNAMYQSELAKFMGASAKPADPSDSTIGFSKDNIDHHLASLSLGSSQYEKFETHSLHPVGSVSEGSGTGSLAASTTSSTTRRLFSEVVSSPSKAVNRPSHIIDLESDSEDFTLHEGDVVDLGYPVSGGEPYDVERMVVKIMERYENGPTEMDLWSVPEGEKMWGSEC